MKKVKRTQVDATLDKLSWHISIEKKHRDAGFKPIPLDAIKKGFYNYLVFLQMKDSSLSIDFMKSGLS